MRGCHRYRDLDASKLFDDLRAMIERLAKSRSSVTARIISAIATVFRGIIVTVDHVAPLNRTLEARRGPGHNEYPLTLPKIGGEFS
jgi:hypothetical protein